MEILVEPGTSPAKLTPSNTPVKKRSFSASLGSLAPSPHIRETSNVSKDDNGFLSSPRTPRGPHVASRGLHLQMPSGSMIRPSPSPAASPAAKRAPLSPQLDPMTSYGLSATSLPRHSRGLDFSRASTNLHHSTLAESSPDSSPVINQKSMSIPTRKESVSSMMLDSPNLGPGSGWPSLAYNERSTVSSSVGSSHMLASPSGSSESDDDELMDDNEESIYTTPQVHRLSNVNAQTPYTGSNVQSPGGTWSNNFSPASASLMKTFQRSRLRKGRRSRRNSGSISGASGVPSPRNTSPPPVRSIETASGYFGWPRFSSTRRESLAMGTEQLHLSSSNDSGDEASVTAPSTPGVIRRAVTRRSNLLPKTKGFARIRAALMEENAPVDTEVRREAETVRQVRERDDGPTCGLSRSNSMSGTSPVLTPTISSSENALEDIPEDGVSGLDGQNNTNSKGLVATFSRQASKNSGGSDFWNRFDKDFRTPPPPQFPGRGSSNASDDINMESPADNMRSESMFAIQESGITDDISVTTVTNAGAGAPLKTFGKRAREDDFDISSIKRRAVSPSLSVQNSPVVPHSPRRERMNTSLDRDSSEKEKTDWGQPPKMGRETSAAASSSSAVIEHKRSNSGGSLSSMTSSAPGSNAGLTATTGAGVAGGPKRVGLQGMTDTSDGFMKMSIE